MKISSIIGKTSNHNIPLIEVNPGIGTLTDHLLKCKTTNLQLIEVNDMLFKHINQSYGQRFPCYRLDFCGLWRLAYIDKQDNGDRVSKLLEVFAKKNWKDEISSRIIVSTGSLAFYKHLISSVIQGSTLFGHGRHEIYAVIPPILYLVIIPFTVLFATITNYILFVAADIYKSTWIHHVSVCFGVISDSL